VAHAIPRKGHHRRLTRPPKLRDCVRPWLEPGRSLAVLAGVFLTLCAVCAAEYPSRPVRMIVPFPPGGSADLIARLVSQRAAVHLGQPVVIENRPGAGGNLGTSVAARAAPDGYTIVLCTIGTCAINRAMVVDMPYDLERDFSPIVLIGAIPNVLTVNPSVSARSVAELVALARAKPGEIAFGSSGIGSSNHLSGVLLESMAGIDLLHVPYKGSGLAITDLRGGQIQVLFDNAPSILPHVEAGDVRALAVTGVGRMRSMPSVPTMEEAGYPGFVVSPWFGVLAPARTPSAVIDKLSRSFGAALNEPPLRQKLETLEVTVEGGDPAKLARHIRAETVRWTQLVESRHLRGAAAP
jgi:tripartite-type tricarboxylate transporter receptor subunit TctC